jgi:DNA polymerase-1
VQTKIIHVTDNLQIKHVKKDILAGRLVGIDTETTSLDPVTGKIRLIQLSTPVNTWVLDVFQLSKTRILNQILKPLLSNEGIVKVFHNAKFDLQFIQTNFKWGLREHRMIFDTYIADKMVRGGQQFTSSLENLCDKLLDVDLPKDEQKSNWHGTLSKEQIVYAALDAAVLLPLYRILSEAIRNNALQKAAWLEFNVIPAIAQMELNGIEIDKDAWLHIADSEKEKMMELHEKMVALHGDINFNSNGAKGQAAAALSAVCGFPLEGVSKPYLTTLMMENPDESWVQHIKDFREYKTFAKRQSTYGYSFVDYIHPVTGRIHSNYKQIDLKTARLGSNSPNLANIPRDVGLRRCFRARPGHKFWNSDFSQIELRILADRSQEPRWVQAFENDDDLHASTASAIYRIAIDKVKDDKRHVGKTVNFAIPYGAGAMRVASVLGITIEEATSIIKKFYKEHKTLDNYFRNEYGYFEQFDCLRTASGRLRNVSDWRVERHHAEQMAKNFAIQGTAADIMKLSMLRMYRELPETIKQVNSVYDETVTEIPDDLVDEWGPEIDRIMIESAQEFVTTIPIKCEGHADAVWSKEAPEMVEDDDV